MRKRSVDDLRVGDVLYAQAYARALAWSVAIRLGVDAIVVRRLDASIIEVDVYRWRRSKLTRVARKIRENTRKQRIEWTEKHPF